MRFRLMSDFGSKKQLSASVSHGDVLPVSILREKTLPEILKKATAYDTGIIAIDGKNTKQFQSYRDLLREAECILGNLRQNGLKPQDKVILQLQHPRYFFACLWGCFLGGFCAYSFRSR